MKFFTTKKENQEKKPQKTFDLEYAKWRSDMEWLFKVNENLDEFKEMSTDEFKTFINTRVSYSGQV